MKREVFPTVGVEPKVIVLKLTNNLRHKVNLEVAAEMLIWGHLLNHHITSNSESTARKYRYKDKAKLTNNCSRKL